MQRAWGRRALTRSACVTSVEPDAKKYRDVRNALANGGWSVVRWRGPHEIWAHPDRENRIVLAGKDGDSVPVGTLGSIRRASSLDHLQ
jgi:predicted RNA binding protein YcfA (HicA-like mRNA interferase family)